MVRKTAGLPVEEVSGVRLIRHSDTVLLGVLMFEAYQGTVDYAGETLDQSIGEIEETLNGKYGPVIWEASFIVMSGQKAISAIVFVHFEKEKMPLLAFTMTHPEFKGQGYSKKLIGRSLGQLTKMKIDECCLVVTEGNQPAQGIYERLGFQYKS